MNDMRDDEVDDGQVAALYRETRNGVEPPAWLDERILTAARLAVEPPKTTSVTPLPRRRRSARFWTAPVALAATVALTVGLVQMMRTHESSAPLEQLAPLEEMKASRSLTKPAAEPEAAPLNSQAEAPAADRALPPAAPPVPAQPAAPAAGAVQGAPVPAPAPPALSPGPGRSRTLPAERRKEESLRAGPALREEDKEEKGTTLKQAVRRPPAEWLTEIASLRQQGRMAEAEASLAEFRRQYPDYPVDKALEPLR